MRVIYLICLPVLLIISACHKDSDYFTEERSTQFSPEIVEETHCSLLGYVFDEENRPVAGAKVQIYSATTQTDEFGTFRLPNARMDKNGTFVKVFKEGYVFGSDMLYPDNSLLYSFVRLLKLENGKTFHSQTGGSVVIQGGGTITFPENGIVLSNGTGFNGDVHVTAKLLSPDDEYLTETMPGALIGEASNGNTVVLGTAGMIAVELRSPTGNKLQLKEGTKARVEIPAMITSPPQTMPLWWFDEVRGLWIEEGSAVLENGFYNGEVSHFSFWNCDVPYPLVHLCGQVLYDDDIPAAQVKVHVKVDGLRSAAGITDEDGVFCGKFPKGEVLSFRVTDIQCGQLIFETTLGPFSENTKLDPFMISWNKTEVNGTVKCSGVPLKGAVVLVKNGGTTKLLQTKDDGFFSIRICPDTKEDVIITGINSQSGGAAVTIEKNYNQAMGVTLETCINPCDFNVKLKWDCNQKTLKAEVEGLGNNYLYQWDNGSTQSVISIHQDSFGMAHCVEVSDLESGCPRQFCFTVPTPLKVELFHDCLSGKITSRVSGGEKPYKYQWNTGSDESFIYPDTSGEFCLTVTDMAGCEIISCVNVEGEGLFVDDLPSSCNKDQFEITTGQFVDGYIVLPDQGSQNLQVSYPIEISVFETGFQFKLVLWNESCEVSKVIQLPRFNGLKINGVQNSSCDGCDDGQIDIMINEDATCKECMVGEVLVFHEDDRNTDLTAQNNEASLKKGTYYVVVTDGNTGCYIAIEKAVVK
ncbi:MAG TPA: carboxypeptidase-like regulatory domain-containing protein [Saprospiraceae bacterium]|nr:carboxypeptidase-like regulatory domain-containing protein [Saprospiraceae bacterium]